MSLAILKKEMENKEVISKITNEVEGYFVQGWKILCSEETRNELSRELNRRKKITC